VYFTSSQVVDAEVMVRQDPTSSAVKRHVRFECNTGACWRYEGPAVPFPPPAVSAIDYSTIMLGSRPGDPDGVGQVIGHDVFLPKKVSTTTGDTSVDYLDPDMLYIRLRLAVKGLNQPLEIADGVSLRNTTRFAP
jgi:hypothetical protein